MAGQARAPTPFLSVLSVNSVVGGTLKQASGCGYAAMGPTRPTRPYHAQKNLLTRMLDWTQ